MREGLIQSDHSLALLIRKNLESRVRRGSPEEEASGSLFYVFLSLGVSSDPFGAQ